MPRMRSNSDPASSDPSAADRPEAARSSSDRPAPDPPEADRAPAEPTAADSPEADRRLTDALAAEQAGVDPSQADRQPTDAPEAERVGAARSGAASAGADSPEADQQLADTLAADPSTGRSVTAPTAAAPLGTDSPAADRSGAGSAGVGRAAEREPRSHPRVERDLLRAVALALVLAAAVAAVWTGWSWYAAAHDDDAAFAKTRDTVLSAGEQAVQNMNTLDHADVAHGLDVWESSSTGDLHTQLVQGRADFEKQVRQAQTVSIAKVLSGAVTELDTRTGKASVMVALRITVDAPKSKPSVKESRMLGELTRTAAGWKLSELGEAPLGESASAAPSASATPASPTSPTTAAGH
jgi:Mce-associated membrane protein